MSSKSGWTIETNEESSDILQGLREVAFVLTHLSALTKFELWSVTGFDLFVAVVDGTGIDASKFVIFFAGFETAGLVGSLSDLALVAVVKDETGSDIAEFVVLFARFETAE